MNTYEIIYWTNPASFTDGQREFEHIMAENPYDAANLAKQRHPGWAVMQVTLFTTPYDDDPLVAER